PALPISLRTVLRRTRRFVGSALRVTEIPAVRQLVEGTLDALGAGIARVEVHRQRGDATDAARLEPDFDLRPVAGRGLGETGFRLFHGGGPRFCRERGGRTEKHDGCDDD